MKNNKAFWETQVVSRGTISVGMEFLLESCLFQVEHLGLLSDFGTFALVGLEHKDLISWFLPGRHFPPSLDSILTVDTLFHVEHFRSKRVFHVEQFIPMSSKGRKLMFRRPNSGLALGICSRSLIADQQKSAQRLRHEDRFPPVPVG